MIAAWETRGEGCNMNAVNKARSLAASSFTSLVCGVLIASYPFAGTPPLATERAFGATSSEKQAEADEIARRIDALQTQYNEAEVEYERAQADARQAAENAEKASKRMGNAEEHIAQLQSQLGERAASIYRSSRNSSFWGVLLGSQSFSEFLTYWDMANRLAEQDASLIEATREAKAEAQDAERDCEGQQALAEEKMGEAKAAQAEIALSQRALEQELSRVTEEVAMLRAAEDEERMREEEAHRRESEAQRLAEEARSNASAGYVAAANPGYFALPLEKYRVTSEFGWRAWSNSYHSGIDLATASGTPIKAAAAGVVTYTGWYGGGGNTVIVNHGNGFRTVYMHMSEFGTTVGKQVAQGEVIGYVGSTGNSTGPHLHFNIEINEQPVNPRYYVQF